MSRITLVTFATCVALLVLVGGLVLLARNTFGSDTTEAASGSPTSELRQVNDAPAKLGDRVQVGPLVVQITGYTQDTSTEVFLVLLEVHVENPSGAPANSFAAYIDCSDGTYGRFSTSNVLSTYKSDIPMPARSQKDGVATQLRGFLNADLLSGHRTWEIPK
jgi:hypothetical protein